MKYIEIGYTKKPHGVKGELKMHVEDEYLEDFLRAEAVFLEIASGMVPCFTESVRDVGNLVVKFEDVDDPKAAAIYVGKKMFLQEQDITHPAEDESGELQFAWLVGFSVVEKEAGAIGSIRRVEEFPQQEMAIVAAGEKELLIPLTPDLIEQIDEKDQVVRMILPEGLLEL